MLQIMLFIDFVLPLCTHCWCYAKLVTPVASISKLVAKGGERGKGRARESERARERERERENQRESD
jgi:hypothetical protein